MSLRLPLMPHRSPVAIARRGQDLTQQVERVVQGVATNQEVKYTQKTIDKTANQTSETFSGFGGKIGFLKWQKGATGDSPPGPELWSAVPLAWHLIKGHFKKKNPWRSRRGWRLSKQNRLHKKGQGVILSWIFFPRKTLLGQSVIFEWGLEIRWWQCINIDFVILMVNSCPFL